LIVAGLERGGGGGGGVYLESYIREARFRRRRGGGYQFWEEAEEGDASCVYDSE
jgi:hypothetical protein